MKISLIHPSKGRPGVSYLNWIEWQLKSGLSAEDVELIVAVDSNDPTKELYIKHYAGMCHEYLSRNVVEATNNAARISTGDILIYLSDDFKCPDNWGNLVIDQFKNEYRPLLLKVDDCLQEFNTAIVTIPIMNRALYQGLGYFWHPGYKSMFVDEDLYWTAMRIGALKKCPQLKFPHHHYSNPDDSKRADRDATYMASEANWNQGKDFFRHRKLSGFPI